MPRMFWFVAALAAGTPALAAPALAPAGPPQTQRAGWSQHFVMYGAQPFEHVQLVLRDGTGPFVTPDGFDPNGFVPVGWTQTANDGLLLVGDGASTSTLEFTLKFVSDPAQPVKFFCQTWANAGGMLAETTVAWSGTQWTITVGSPWADTRVTGGCARAGELSLPTYPYGQVCYDREGYGPNDTVTVHVRMTGMAAPYAVVGGQFFLSFDPARLRFEDVVPGDPPFVKEVYKSVDSLGGTIDFAVGLNFGDSGTFADTTMAVLTFTAIEEVCAPQHLLAFREQAPGSLLTTACCGDVCPLLLEPARIEIDSTPPILHDCLGGPPADPVQVTVECDELSEAYPVSDPQGHLLVTATDSCDDPNDPTDDVVVEFEEDRQDGPCASTYVLTRTWSAHDACGNTIVRVLVLNVVDTAAPAISDVPPDDSVECDLVDVLYPVYDELGHLLVTATDNCDVSPVVAFEADYSYPDPACSGTYTLTRRWTATDACGNSDYRLQVLDVHDTTPPTWDDPNSLPPYITVSCDAVPPAVAPPARDNCAGALALDYQEHKTEFGCGDTYTLTRIWTYSDGCGNSISHTQVISVVDDVPPAFVGVCPTDGTVSCDAVPDPPVLEAQDNCDEHPSVTFLEYQVPGECEHSYRLQRVWLATDRCGNWIECRQDLTVQDRTAPTITCAADVVRSADVGTCELTLCPPSPTASDSCDPAPIITGYRWDGLALCGAPYPAGDTVITWEATDDCGNFDACDQTVTVLPVNEMAATVELQINLAASGVTQLSRCITFELCNCATPGATPVEYDAVLTFVDTGDPNDHGAVAVASTVLPDVPCGAYTCVSARDKLHALAATADLAIADGHYVATFVGPAGRLRGGNANDDDYIDIRDYGVFVGEWARHYDGNGDGADDGETPCGAFTRHADFSGNGVVWQEDFMYIRDNFLAARMPGCCGGSCGALRGTGPLDAVSVADLIAQGLGRLALADLNEDGWVDRQDVTAFAHGMRPTRPGDLNGDGTVDNFDIEPFALALTNPAAYGLVYPPSRTWAADCNRDGVIDQFDIESFVDLLVSH